MGVFSILDSQDIDLFNASKYLKFDEKAYRNSKIISIGAMILNGFTRERVVGNVIIPSSNSSASGVSDGVYTLVYLPNYNLDLGFERSNIASPERIICDYFLYPSLRIPQIYDFMEEYGESIGWDFTSTYEMMGKFGLDKGLLDKLIEETRQTMNQE